MNSTTKFKFSKTQGVLLIITSIAFIVLTWRMVPLDNTLKLAICLFLGSFVFLMVISFADYLSCFKAVSSAKMATIITMIVFMAFPLTISIFYSIHEEEYLVSYPADNQISVKITYDIDRVGGSGSIGYEWVYKHYLNDTEFKNGDIVDINGKTAFTIKSRFIEHDSVDDIGESTSKQYNYSENDNYKKTLSISQKVHVVERGGRKNAGSTADFNATYKLERVVPTSMSYWDIFLYTSNDTEHTICIILIVGQILCIACIIFVLINGRKKEAYAKGQEQIRKKQEEEYEQIRIAQKLEEECQRQEREFLAGKEEFLKKLQGQSIRQAAGVPPYVSFVNGLPRDNNDAPYGSFTVYCSSSGKCYHDKIGCCSARRPVHYFNAEKKYRPCSKCCTKQRSVPQWYMKYNTLKSEAKHYKIDISE